ncbi:MAG: type II secretion system F family protein, partial [Pseudomonadota bacterium]
MAKQKKAARTPTFVWSGVDQKGSKRQGEIIAKSAALAKAQLRKQNIRVTKIKAKSKPLFSPAKKPITPLEIAIFSRQMATMMASGVPLVQSFEIVGNGHDNPSMAEMIMKLKASVESGNSLTEALREHPLQFDDLYCNLVQAGEQAGILDDILDKVAIYKEKTEAIKAKIKKALFYPIAVMVVAAIVVTILLLFVVPQFETIFADFGATLPGPTLIVINMSKFLQQWWWVIFGIAFGALTVFNYFRKRSRKMRETLDRIMLKLAIIGPILEKAAIARFARTLSTMFAAGVPLVEALDGVAGAVGNIVFSNGVIQIKDEVSTGTQVQVAMKNTNLFPNMVVQMVAIGEESGSLDKMLSKVADFYEAEVDNLVDGLSSLLEPIIMAVLGVIIGGIVVAMYMPIFKLGEV